jgi:hypothetical protein
MGKRLLGCSFAVIAAVAATACLGFEHSSSLTGPSNTGLSALMGTWVSASVVPSASSCTDFNWNVTEQTSMTVKGSFTATCANNLQVTGTAQGTMSGSTIQWSAVGNAIAPDLPACAITLTGTAEVSGDSIRVPYSGTTCMGPVSGVEILKRR